MFIVATNRLRSFDAAVIRPGRFDVIMFVGTPNIESRVKRLADKLKATTLSADCVAKATTVFESVLSENWETLRFLTFAENEALIAFTVDCAVSLHLTLIYNRLSLHAAFRYAAT